MAQIDSSIMLKIVPGKVSIVDTIEILKSASHLPKKIIFIWFNESPLKMMKNAFYFIIKALFILKIFTFLS